MKVIDSIDVGLLRLFVLEKETGEIAYAPAYIPIAQSKENTDQDLLDTSGFVAMIFDATINRFPEDKQLAAEARLRQLIRETLDNRHEHIASITSHRDPNS